MKYFFVLTTVVFFFSAANGQRPASLPDGIPVAGIQDVFMDSAKMAQMTRWILADSFPNFHSLLVARDRQLVYEKYLGGKDEIWGYKLSYVDHQATSLHDVRSISKSVVSACIGIALMQHLIQSIDDPIFDYLSGYLAYRRADNSKITIRHLLTMSSGIEWEEDRSYADGENDENRMEKSSEPVAFVLQRPLDHPPGAQWKYNSGGVQVLAAIIRSVSGLDIDQFAAQYLFKPLGIVNYQWIRMRPGFPAAASGLRLTSRDMLKLGWLYLEKGAWDHVQVLPAAWVIQSLQTQVLRDSQTRTRGYGFLFWTFSDSVNGQSFDISAAVGNGGQRIFINQAHRLVVVITAGNYNNFAIEKNGEYALSKFILPSLHEGP